MNFKKLNKYLNPKNLLVAMAVFAQLFTATSVFAQACDPATDPNQCMEEPKTSGCTPGGGALPTAIFVPWYHYLEGEGTGKDCTPVLGDDVPKAVGLIILAVIDTLMRVSGILATAYLIWGAVQYVTSQGDQNGIANAKSTITNAIIGMVVILLSIGAIQFLGNLAR